MHKKKEVAIVRYPIFVCTNCMDKTTLPYRGNHRLNPSELQRELLPGKNKNSPEYSSIGHTKQRQPLAAGVACVVPTCAIRSCKTHACPSSWSLQTNAACSSYTLDNSALVTFKVGIHTTWSPQNGETARAIYECDKQYFRHPNPLLSHFFIRRVLR